MSITCLCPVLEAVDGMATCIAVICTYTCQCCAGFTYDYASDLEFM